MRNKNMDKEESENWEWVLVGMRGQRKLIKKKINQFGGNPGASRGGGRPPHLLTGGNTTALHTRERRSTENPSSQPNAPRGAARGRVPKGERG